MPQQATTGLRAKTRMLPQVRTVSAEKIFFTIVFNNVLLRLHLDATLRPFPNAHYASYKVQMKLKNSQCKD